MSSPFSSLTSDDYLQAAQALLPRGPAWPRDQRATLTKFLNAVATVAWQAHQALVTLFDTELDPANTSQLLPEWEAAFGIKARGSKKDRRARLLIVIEDPGGFTAAHVAAIGASLAIGSLTEPYLSVVVTGPFAWTLHGPMRLATDSDTRTALEAQINAMNRMTCTVTFSYNL